mgnify:CR=1 FL=1|tara:strand:- start:2435 stop:3967 length:1533 start_codon:yes stop_codon:yes gene_type:complete
MIQRSVKLPSLSPVAPFVVAAALALALPVSAQGLFSTLPGSAFPSDADETRSVALGDVDGDGDLDVVFGSLISANRLYRNDGRGNFVDVSATSLPVDADMTQAVALGDVDGDGDLDLVCGNHGQQDRLYENDGLGGFVDVTAGRMPADAALTPFVELADLDGDGDLDMLLSGPLRLYENNGVGQFVDVTAARLPVVVLHYGFALGDVDADGDLDLVAAGYLLLRNDGSGTFTDDSAGNMPVVNGNGRVTVLGDVDGDGDLDLLGNDHGFSPFGSPAGALFFNDGGGSFTVGGIFGVCGSAAALSDVDGDGDLDAILCDIWYAAWSGDSDGRKYLHLNDGTGTFSQSSTPGFAFSEGPCAVALGDLDGDGDLDAVTANVTTSCGYDGGDLVDFNLTRQLHAPALPQRGQAYVLEAYMRAETSGVAGLGAVFLSTALVSPSIPTSFGSLGIAPAQAAPLPLLAIPQPAGVATTSFTIPNHMSLAGLGLHAQALLGDLSVDPRLSNTVSGAIQ